MANHIDREEQLLINFQSTAIARLGVVLGRSTKIEEEDFLPFRQFSHMREKTARILQRLINEKTLPNKILLAAQMSLQNK